MTTGIPGTGLSYTTRIADAAPGQARSGASGCGCLLAGLALLFVVGLTAKNPGAATAIGVAAVGIMVVRALLRRGRDARAAAAADLLHQHRWERLCQRFGEDAARSISSGSLWVGATAEMVVEMLGDPIDVEETVMRTKTKRTLKYARTGANRYGLRVFVDDGIVVGWEDKR